MKNTGGVFQFEAEHDNGSAISIVYYLLGDDIPQGIEFDDNENGLLRVPAGLVAGVYGFEVVALLELDAFVSVTQPFTLTISNPAPSNSNPSTSNPVPTLNPDVVTDLSDTILYESPDPESPSWVPVRQTGAPAAGCDVEYLVIVPYGTDRTAMALKYALSAGASCDVPNMTPRDYTAVSNEKGGYVDFTVTYRSGSTYRVTHRIYVREEPRLQIASPDLFAYDPHDPGMTGWTLLGIRNKDGTYWTLISAPLSSDMSARPFPDLVFVDQAGLSGISVAPLTAGDGERRFELRGTASDRAALDGITLNSVSCVWLDEESRTYTQIFEPPVSPANIAAQIILQEPEELIQYVSGGGGGCDAAATGAGCLLALTGMAALTRVGRSKNKKISLRDGGEFRGRQ
ncbi:MAG: hypothetical protein LBF92_08570 [Synergistaceae bacterium]|nr:hypothetical protein [Synergistaceae bacterium]